nr:unknown [Saccharomyces cerevisiae]CAI6411235.1 CBM_HP1_G0008360.mRNA.1.CDS.1 [Saccharomyces cerevisiae]
MQFSTVASIAAIAAVASAASNITTATVTEESTTLVTITSCEDHVCSETVSPALVSTATVTVNDVIT